MQSTHIPTHNPSTSPNNVFTVTSTPKPALPSTTIRWLFVVVLLLLTVWASRALKLDQYEFDFDEIWTLWQSMGTPAQVVTSTPYDWPPGHYLLVNAWGSLVGFHPVPQRVLSVLIFLVGAAAMWRAVRTLFARHALGSVSADWVATLAVIVFAANTVGIYISIQIRAYSSLFTLAMIAFLLTLITFRRGSIGWSVPLGVAVAALFYVHNTGILIVLILVPYTLLFHTKRFFLWALPGILVVLLTLPEIFRKTGLVGTRLGWSTLIGDLSPFFTRLLEFYGEQAVRFQPVWIIVFAVGTIAALWASWRCFRAPRTAIRLPLFIVLWGVLPIAIGYPAWLIGFLETRHLSYFLVGVAVWIAIGLTVLPGVVRTVSLFGLAALMLTTPVFYRYGKPLYEPPYMLVLPYMAQHWRSGDVLVIDSGGGLMQTNNMSRHYQWDYLTRIFFPNGLRVVDDPTGYRRVWYLKIDGAQDPQMEAAVMAGRTADVFFGPWNFLVRLYIAPPDAEGVPFENGMRFHGAEIVDVPIDGLEPSFREGETVTVQLWWAVDRTPPLDYSLSTFVELANGERRGTTDSPPLTVDNQPQTSLWQPDRFYIEQRQIVLPTSMDKGEYDLRFVLYHYSDPAAPIPVSGEEPEASYRFATIDVFGW
jgi:hypothetical protein